LPVLPPAKPDTATFQFLEYDVPTPNADPLSIVAGPDGALWFTEGFAPNVGRIDVNGNITEYPVGGVGELFIAVGPDKNLWFTEDNPNAVGRLTTTGTLTTFRIYHSKGLEDIVRGPDRRMWFESVAQDNGPTYIDAIGIRGHKTQYGPVGSSCYFPLGITVGTDGNLWAVGGRCLSKITPAGQITSMDLGPGIGLNIVTQGKDGNLWAGDNLSPPPESIDQITYGGVVTHHYLPNDTPNVYGVLQIGSKIYFTEVDGNKIGSIDESTFAFKEYPIPTPNAGPGTLTRGPDGNIWFTETRGDKIGVLILR